MWTCNTCREKIDDTESACPTCGAARPDPADSAQSAGNKLLSIIVVCVVIAVLLAIAFWK